MRRTYTDWIFEYYRRKDDDESDDRMTVELGGNFHESGPERKGEIRMTGIKRLLIVDDEFNIRNTYLRVFTRQGFDVLTAPNAAIAKDILVREKIDLVFLDIRMAEVEGDVLFQLIRTFHRDVRVIVSSVYPVEEQRERIKDADAYFDKSDGQEVLLRMVSAMVSHTGRLPLS